MVWTSVIENLEIPFEYIPIPNYFWDVGWFRNENTIKFVLWSFFKCKSERSIDYVYRQQIILEPFEFICTRGKSSKECFLSPEQFRRQIKNFLDAGLLKKTENAKKNNVSSYIWVTDRFDAEKIIESNKDAYEI